MLSLCIIILCINIDALSYGLAYGAQKIKFSFFYTLFTAVLSTIFFSSATYLSRHLYSHFCKQTLEIINGLILIVLGLSYIIPKKQNEKTLKKDFFSNLKVFFFECFAISVDAIFTTFFTNFLGNFLVFFIIFYFITNFMAIYFGNLIAYKIGHSLKFKLSIFSCFIFLKII